MVNVCEGRGGVERVVNAIDVGTTKTSALVAVASDDSPLLHVQGVGIAPSRGMKRGSVENVDEVTDSVLTAVREAEKRAGQRITHALVGVSGVHIAGINSRGSTDVAHPMRGVTQEDVDYALEGAQNIAIAFDQEILHAISRGFTLDGRNNIRQPIGLCGTRLEVDAHLITGSRAMDNTLVKCVKGAGVDVEQLVVESLASGEAVLTPEERESGVALVDIGGGTTDVAVFLGGSVWHSGVIGRGGYLVTRDLSQVLNMPFPQAELLKLQYGHAEPADISEDEMVSVVGFGDGARREVSRLLISQIIEARLEQIFLQVGEEIKRSGYLGLLPAGVVLCGGTAQMSGIRALAKRVLGFSVVRIGTPQGMQGYSEAISNPAYACAVGLLQWKLLYGSASEDDERGRGRPPKKGSTLGELIKRLLPG
jgi:cell division protein FtsA